MPAAREFFAGMARFAARTPLPQRGICGKAVSARFAASNLWQGRLGPIRGEDAAPTTAPSAFYRSPVSRRPITIRWISDVPS